jgi:AraC-like DNA-binding protein
MADKSYSFYKPGDFGLQAGLPFPVEIVSTGHEVRRNRSYRWDKARHGRVGYHIFQYSLKGSGFFEAGGGPGAAREPVGPGRMLIASWDRPFAYYYGGGEAWEFLWITLRGDFADRVSRALAAGGSVIGISPGSPALLLLSSLQDRLAGSVPLDRYEMTCLGYRFLVELLKEGARAAASPEERFVDEARRFVIRDLRGASVSSLARRFGYGEKYFNGYFKRRALVTPNKFILELRLGHAATLLAETSKKVAAVASETGFSEGNYFSKAFRSRYGLSPGEYRRRERGALPMDELVALT